MGSASKGRGEPGRKSKKLSRGRGTLSPALASKKYRELSVISKFHVAVAKCADHCRDSETPELALADLAEQLRREGWDGGDVERLVAAIGNLALIQKAPSVC